MLLKTIIVLLFIAILISLFGGLNFLVKDLGGNNKKRLLYALGIRIHWPVYCIVPLYTALYRADQKSGTLGRTVTPRKCCTEQPIAQHLTAPASNAALTF